MKFKTLILALLTVAPAAAVVADSLPAGWIKAGSQPAEYEVGVDPMTHHGGHASGYVKSPPAASQKRRSAAPTDEKIRRLVRRLHISSSDADLLLGILRQILWKSRSDNHPTR